MTAFRLHYSNMRRVLFSHVEDMAGSCYSVDLISHEACQNITTSFGVASSRKVSELLEAVQKSITAKDNKLLQFVTVMKKQGASIELMGIRLEKTYRE